MSSRSIHINRLEIRLRGISSEAARTAAGSLGHDLVDRLALLPVAGKGTVRIARIDSGTHQLSEATSPVELGSVIAQRITSSIQSKLKSQVNKQ